MPFFRKKPVIVEAVQWFKMGDHASVFLRPTISMEMVPCIETLEGRMVVSPGDWIIRGVAGELYPCKAGIFEATYESA
jgi:hypothetical protein